MLLQFIYAPFHDQISVLRLLQAGLLLVQIVLRAIVVLPADEPGAHLRFLALERVFRKLHRQLGAFDALLRLLELRLGGVEAGLPVVVIALQVARIDLQQELALLDAIALLHVEIDDLA